MGTPVLGLDYCRVTTVTEGTGTYSLGNASPPYLHPSQAPGVVSGGRYVFLVASNNGQVWELVEGILTAGSPYTLTRAQVVVTSAGNQTAINWSNSTHGTRTMTCVSRAGRMALLEDDGRVRAANLANVLLASFNVVWNGPFTVTGTTALQGTSVPIGTRRVFVSANGRNRINGTTNGEARIIRRALAAGGGSVLDDTVFSGSIHSTTDQEEFWGGGVWLDYGAPIAEVREIQIVMQALSGSFIAQNFWWAIEAWGV